MTTIADALGYHEFGVRLVGGWAHGPLRQLLTLIPFACRHVSSIAGGSYGTFGDNWAKDDLSKVDALGDFSHCILNLASASCMRPLA
jgi:hypothetical protein